MTKLWADVTWTQWLQPSPPVPSWLLFPAAGSTSQPHLGTVDDWTTHGQLLNQWETHSVPPQQVVFQSVTQRGMPLGPPHSHSTVQHRVGLQAGVEQPPPFCPGHRRSISTRHTAQLTAPQHPQCFLSQTQHQQALLLSFYFKRQWHVWSLSRL